MSKRHVDEYFRQVSDNYIEMVDALKELEEEAKTGLISPEKLENTKQLVEGIKTNYMRISYIMFLFNQPNKEKKVKKYQSQNKKKLESIPKEHTLNGVVKENKEIINKMK